MTTSHADAATRYPTATIEALPDLPVLRITRDFAATPAQLVRAHTDPDLFLEWAGPADVVGEVDHWDARTGGSYRYVHYRREAPEERYAFHGCFHEVGAHRLVQTFRPAAGVRRTHASTSRSAAPRRPAGMGPTTGGCVLTGPTRSLLARSGVPAAASSSRRMPAK